LAWTYWSVNRLGFLSHTARSCIGNLKKENKIIYVSFNEEETATRQDGKPIDNKTGKIIYLVICPV
jgi:hypothetical protein